MAACLNPTCTCARGRVSYSRTIRTADGKRECWRIVECLPVEMGGCGQTRKQSIRDEGETTAKWIEPETEAKPRWSPTRGARRGDFPSSV